MVYPLVTKADGSKFGKTASGSVWLDPNKTSPYRFYQFWMNADDRDVIGHLKKFTWLTQEEVADLEAKHAEAPHRREAHRTLAQLVTRMIHGDSALAKAEQATAVLFGGALDGLDAADIADIFANVDSTEIPKSQFEGELSVVDMLAQTDLASGKGDARRSIKGGGMYLNNGRIDSADVTVSISQAIEGQYFVLRKGKRKYHLVKVID